MVVSRTQFLPLLLNTVPTYLATQSLDKAGNWEQVPDGDGDTWIYCTAPTVLGSWLDGYSDKEGGGGGLFYRNYYGEVIWQ